ncbi:MAG: translation initiation factor IF-2 [Firmicutes bacterium]|nr:translation initiation factor IF-2 [Bacillota bacterium]
MSKYRAFELAKELSVSSKEVMDALRESGIEINSHFAMIDEAQEKLLRQKFGKKEAAPEPEQKPLVRRIENPEKAAQKAEAGTAEPRPDGERRPRPEGERKPRTEGERRPRPEGERRPRPEGERRPRPEGERRPRPDGERRPRPEGERRPRPEGDRRPRPDGERRPRPDGERRPRPDGERRPRPDGERRPRPEGERKPRPDGQRPRSAGGPKKFEGEEGQQPRRPRPQQSRPKNVDEPMMKKPGSDRAKDRDRDKEKDREKERERENRNNRQKKPGNQNNNAKKGLRDLSQPQHKKPQKKEKKEKVEEVALDPSKILINVPITVSGFAEEVGRPSSEIIMKLMGMGIMATINQNIDEDAVLLLADELGVDVVIGKVEEEIVEEGIDTHEDREDELLPRSPIITVMGHVDHGKTSLLDAIRSTNITATESGGITQHIGASEVYSNGQKIVCLDTPGHEAFTAMRARGAQVTDIAILVVAADDSVMPQTIEAIHHAKAAGVPIIVAVNKIDKPDANPARVKQDLMQHGVLVEEFGGETICVPVSAKTGEGIDNLLEMVLLQADMLELKANPHRAAKGTVVEARLDKAKGPVATVLVMKGTLQVGQPIVAGVCSGRVRAMTDWKGNPLKKAGPATAVEILGLADVPEAGDEVDAVRDERSAKTIAANRQTKLREETIKEKTRVSLEDLFSQIQEGNTKELNILVKADVMGSVGAVTESLTKLSNDEVTVKVVYSGVGTVNESDILLASASNAIIIGFNIRPSANIISMAEKENIEIKTYRVIYDAINDIKAAMVGMLDPEYREVVLGRVEIRTTFKVPGVGTVGGAYVQDGKVVRNAQIRLVRDGIVIHEGKISSLKRFKDDAKEVQQGYECGIGIENYNDIKEGDIIEAFTMEEIERKQA